VDSKRLLVVSPFTGVAESGRDLTREAEPRIKNPFKADTGQGRLGLYLTSKVGKVKVRELILISRGMMAFTPLTALRKVTAPAYK